MSKKIVSIALLLVMMLGCMLVSCSNTSVPSDTSSSDDLDTSAVDTSKTEPELSGKTYGGKNFNVFVSGNGTGKLNDFSEENTNGYSRVASAIYLRNEKLEQMYDIVIEDVEKFGSSTGNGVGYKQITEDFASDDRNYDLCYVGTLDAAQLAMGGYLYDLNTLPYVDLECSWWDQNANDDLAIHGKMFYTTGDISVVDNIATHTLLFNKNVAKQQTNIPDLYELVKQDKWTYDKFLSYVKLVSQDSDGNTIMNEKDMYGLLTWNDVLQASLIGSGIRLVTVNSEGELELTLYSEKTVWLIDDLCSVFNDGNYVYNYTTRNMVGTQPSATYDAERDAMFSEDRCLFYGMVLNAVPRYRDSATLDFGILPYPKYNEEQEFYGSYVGASYSSMICVEGLLSDDDKEFVGTVIESVAYESQKIVTPEYYDQTLKGRYLKDEESWDMLDIIFSERIFDVGMYYKIPQTNPLTAQITALIASRENNTFTSRYEATVGAARDEIAELNDLWFKFS